MNALEHSIETGWETRTELSPKSASAETREAVGHVLGELDAGRLRVPDKRDGQ